MQENINIPDSTITTNLSFRNLVLMNMQQLTNFPYIEKDFDALTDYELLCLVVKFLNDVIANQNEQNASITRMYNSFLALQDYVNNTKDELEDAFNNLDDYVRNYFDNLDVQDEINNKLDQMLEDGVLEQIIEQFLQSTALWCFDTVADMKAATNLTNGSYTKTLGFYSKNDGGGSIYKIRTKTQDDTLNEMDLLAVYDQNLCAELIEDVNNVLCYGVSLTDANENNHTIIKHVIDTVKFAYCKKDIVLSTSLVIDSSDSKFTFKKITYTGDSYAILLNNTDIVLEGEYLDSNYDGLRLGLSNLVLFCNIKINRIKVENIGVLLGGTAGVYYNTLDITRLDYKTNGVKCLLDDYHVGEITFYNTAFSDSNDDTTTRYAFHCHATNYRATGFKFYNCSIEGSHGGFYFEGTGKLCEYIQIFGLRATECSYNNYKVLKVKCNQTTIPLYGDIFFDNAKPSSFDFSEYTVGSNDALILHGAFRNDFVSSNGLLGYEAHPSYTRLVITKLPRGYESLRTGDTPQLVKSTSIVGLPPSGSTTENTLKIKLGDSSYTYNGHLQIFVDNQYVTGVDIYASDGTTLVKNIPTSGKTIINAEFRQLFASVQTQLIYSISSNGSTSLFS